MLKHHRIAFYFAPAFDHPLWHSGSRWLGRDAGGELLSDEPSPVATALTAAPARYGFHATLKAPFRLRAGIDIPDVIARVQELARDHAAFVMPPLSVQMLDGFVALMPEPGSTDSHESMNRLAVEVVSQLDDLREPIDPQELELRAVGLNDEQAAMLHRWGYPFVLNTWRFHLTLTRKLQEADDPASVLARARRFFAPVLALPLRCDDICLFVEPEPGADLVCWRRVMLG